VPPFSDGKSAIATVAGCDEETARADAGRRAALVEPAFREAARARVSAAGLAAVSEAALAVATSAGARRAFRSTAAKLDVIGADGRAQGRCGRVHRAIAALDAQAIAEDACARAMNARDPIELAPGSYDAILEPACVAELLEWLAFTAFGARSLEDGSSLLAGRAGQSVTGEVTILDDALAGEEGAPVRPFDAEGTPAARIVFLDHGIAGTPAHDRASAARAGVAPTGHANPVGDELATGDGGGPVPQHLHMLGGADDDAALLARVERGVWVSRFHYVNGLIDTRRALMTGMTRDGLFLVENGKRGRALANLRWSQSLLEAFQRIAGLTRARLAVAASLGDSVLVCPTVLVRGWRFTS
jgi:predicted Zn-dependent protease